MSAARSYATVTLDDRRAYSPPHTTPPDDPDESATAGAGAPDSGEPAARESIDLSSLSIAGFTRRRVGWACAAFVAAWIVVIFARQAGDGAAAAARADQVARDNTALANEVASLEHELQVIERPEYVAQQARGFDLGTDKEIPFTLDPSVPTPGPDAPGSASTRVGADAEHVTPLESWLSLLFGPANQPAAPGRRASGGARVDRCAGRGSLRRSSARPAGTARADGADTLPAAGRPMIAGTSSGRTGRAKK
jgi:cell division protein FtsB